MWEDLIVMLVALAGGVGCFSDLFWLIVFRFLLLLPIGCDGLRGWLCVYGVLFTGSWLVC